MNAVVSVTGRKVVVGRSLATRTAAAGGGASRWPKRSEGLAYGEAADALAIDALQNAEIVREEEPCLAGGEAALAILEHEVMHQETLLYMAHRLPYETKRRMDD